MVRKLFILFFLSNSWLFGCALCTLSKPIVNIHTKISTTNNLINFHIKWEMPKDFSTAVAESFDINGNEIYEKNELSEIQKVLEFYLIPNQYLTFLKTSELPQIT